MDVSVVCPFYNESAILETAVRTLLARLETLPGEWELIIVDDGSQDGSRAVAEAIQHDRLVVIGYKRNRGRGNALRTGIVRAQGDIIVTTEIDLSWGENIVHELADALNDWPDADIVVASPHLAGGAYRNVPAKRVWFSRVGNLVIRACMSNAATMNTGMTRGYRAQAVKGMPLNEDGKEFHLEVILKAAAFGLRIREIPAVLEWKEYKHQGARVERKSSSRVKKLVMSHTLFSLFATPVRYVWGLATMSIVLGVLGVAAAMYFFAVGLVSAYAALLGVSLVILGIVLFVIGVVLQQGNMIQRELWHLHRKVGDSPANDLPAS